MNQERLRLPEDRIGPVKMVFLDLDGTALDNQKNLSGETVQALRMLKSRGIPYTFASARSACMMELYCHQAGISGPIIALEGAEIRIHETGNILCSFPIAAKDAAELMKFCHDLGVDYTFYTSDSAYLRQNTRRLPRFRKYNDDAVAQGFLPIPCKFYEVYGSELIAAQKVLKIVCTIEPGSEADTAMGAFLKEHPSLRAERSEGILLSIVSASVSKASAIQLFCQMLGIPIQAVCCFGDYYNDMDMLHLAGYSVAMGNAPDEVRDAAQFVTASNEENGVAEFIRRFICGEPPGPAGNRS